MATFNQRDVQTLFVGGAATKTTGGISTLNEGEIGLFTPAGTRLTETTALTATEFIIVQDRGADTPLVSNVIKKADIKSAVRKVYTAATEQIDFIGYNGTSGAIVVANETNYHVRISLRQSKTSNHGGMYLKHGYYTSDSTATQSEIAAGLHESLVFNFKREADKMIKAERLNSAAGVALGTAVGPVNFVKGSKYFSAADIDDATINPALVVGGYIRIGTTVNDPVYQIVAMDTTTNVGTLDVQYQGETATIADTALESITAAAEVGTDWGIKLEGLPLKFSTGKLHYDKVSWDLSLENFGATPIDRSVAATLGSGTENYMKELEFFCQGNEGDYFRMGEPNINDRRSDVSGNYALIDITTESIYTGSIVAGPVRKVMTLAIPDTTPNYALNATGDDITDVLEVLVYGAAGAELSLG